MVTIHDHFSGASLAEKAKSVCFVCRWKQLGSDSSEGFKMVRRLTVYLRSMIYVGLRQF